MVQQMAPSVELAATGSMPIDPPAPVKHVLAIFQQLHNDDNSTSAGPQNYDNTPTAQSTSSNTVASPLPRPMELDPSLLPPSTPERLKYTFSDLSAHFLFSSSLRLLTRATLAHSPPCRRLKQRKKS